MPDKEEVIKEALKHFGMILGEVYHDRNFIIRNISLHGKFY